MKVLITGGAGFIGSATARALLNNGHQVRIMDNLQPPVHPKTWDIRGPEHDNVVFVAGDVRDAQLMWNCLKGVDAVLHLAAYQDFRSDWSTFFNVNSAGAALLYEIIVREQLPIKRVVLASTQSLLGEGAYTCDNCMGRFMNRRRTAEQMRKGQWNITCPRCQNLEPRPAWTREDEIAPAIPYGVSKLAAEQISTILGAQYDIPTVNLRYSIVQGALQSPRNAYSGVLRTVALQLLGEKDDIVIFEDGQQQRDFVDIQDVVNANVGALMGVLPDGAYHVGGGVSHTVEYLAQTMVKMAGRDLDDIKTPGMYRVSDIRHTLSSVDKLMTHGWRPDTPIETTWKNYWEWLPTVIDPTEARKTVDAAWQTMIDTNSARVAVPVHA